MTIPDTLATYLMTKSYDRVLVVLDIYDTGYCKQTN